MASELTVVIPTFQRPDLCLGSIAAVEHISEATGIDIDLVVVEQGPEPSYPIPSGFSGRWLFTRRVGVSSARNLGLAQADAPFVIFVDDDAELLAGIGAVLETCREPRVDVVCGRMVATDGTVIRGADRPRRVRPWNAFNLFVEPATVWRTAAIRRLGGFDERLGPPFRLGAEEGAGLLASLSRGRRGRRHVFVPVDLVVHPALEAAPDDKARRYGAGASSLIVLAPGAWSVVYGAVSVVRRLGGLITRLVRRDGPGASHRRAWLRGFASGIGAGWSVRREPRNLPTLDVVVLRPAHD